MDSTINVPDTAAISDVNVRVRLNHTFDGDLVISLVHPDGTVINLSNRRGGSGDGFGSGSNDCSGTHTVFDDQASTAISAGAAPFAGSFTPDQPLSGLNGKLSAGNWKLRISDNAGLDIGTLFCWQLEISRQVFVCCGVAGTPAVISAGSAVSNESCSVPNGAVDPDETVTVDFALNNAGSGGTTNLVATLLPGGGVLAPSGPQNYGVVPAGGPAVSRPFTFVATGNCGDTITATLQLQDGAINLGTMSFPLRLGTTVSTTYGPFLNSASISIPAGAPTTTSGAASPYPSDIAVSGILGTVSKVKVTLSGINHTFPSDIDILLVGPAGQRIILMSDVGSGTDLVNVTLTFDDAGPALPIPIISGTYRPTNSGTGDIFPAPAPAAPYGSALSDFNGTNPNGTWSLYVNDDAGGDSGNIAGGWSLSFETSDPVCCLSACLLTCAPIVQANDPGQSGAIVNFTLPPVSGSCGVVTSSIPSGSFFPIGTTPVTVTATRQDGSTTSCQFPVTVLPVSVTLQDPAICLGAGGLVGVTATITNNSAVAVNANFMATLPTTLNGLPGTGLASLNQAGLNVTASAVTWMGMIPANTTVIITYKTQLAAGTPANMPICINSDVIFNNGPKATVQACATLNCPAGPVNVAVSDQKAGALLVFPYYTSQAATHSDTRLTFSNVGDKTATLHVFFIDGTTCQQSDSFLCLTPNASFSFKASEYDAETTGWILAVAVDAQGRPTQYNGLIGNAFVRDGEYVGNYGAESFRANSPLLASINNDTATLFFDGASYDAMPNQFAVEIQSAADAAGQRVVTVGLQGDLSQSQVRGAAQVGIGRVINGNENPSGSFIGWLQGGCQAQALISQTSPRVPSGMNKMVPSGQSGTMLFNIGAGVGIVMTPRSAPWKGIRTLHKTGLTATTLTIPLLVPVC